MRDRRVRLQRQVDRTPHGEAMPGRHDDNLPPLVEDLAMRGTPWAEIQAYTLGTTFRM